MKQYKLKAGDPIIYWRPGEREGRFGRSAYNGDWPKCNKGCTPWIGLRGQSELVDVDRIAPVTGFAVSGEDHWHECATFGDAERYITDIGAKDCEILAITVDDPEQVVNEVEAGALPTWESFYESLCETVLTEYVLGGVYEPPRWIGILGAVQHQELWNEVMRDAVAEFLRRCEVKAERLHRIERTEATS